MKVVQREELDKGKAYRAKTTFPHEVRLAATAGDFMNLLEFPVRYMRESGNRDKRNTQSGGS